MAPTLSLFFVLFSVTACSASSATPAGYGVAVNGHPTWTERAALGITNAIRMAPTDWKNKWASGNLGAGVLTPGTYPPVPPLRWNTQLGQSAAFHSNDMQTNNCFQHNSCDGTDVFTRIKSYYTASGWLGENIAEDGGSAADMIQLLVCEGSPPCVTDGQGDGHRANIMSTHFQALGVGNVQSYWTQDFGGVATGSTPPVTDGSHLPPTDPNVTFFLNYYDARAAQSVRVNVSGTDHTMAVALGSAAQGTWSTTLSAGSGCQSYYFSVVDANGTVWHYPASGTLNTTGVGGCSQE